MSVFGINLARSKEVSLVNVADFEGKLAIGSKLDFLNFEGRSGTYTRSYY